MLIHFTEVTFDWCLQLCNYSACKVARFGLYGEIILATYCIDWTVIGIYGASEPLRNIFRKLYANYSRVYTEEGKYSCSLEAKPGNFHSTVTAEQKTSIKQRRMMDCIMQCNTNTDTQGLGILLLLIFSFKFLV